MMLTIKINTTASPAMDGDPTAGLAAVLRRMARCFETEPPIQLGTHGTISDSTGTRCGEWRCELIEREAVYRDAVRAMVRAIGAEALRSCGEEV